MQFQIARFTLSIILFLTTFLSNAQIMFQRHYGGSGDEYGSLCLQTSDGGYIVVGTTDSYGAGGYDIYLIKTNEYGDTVWTRTYGGTGNEVSSEIIHTADGGFAILGRTNSYGSGNNDCYLIKTNQSGDTTWTKTYGGIGNESAYGIVQTTDSGFLISGNTASFGPVTGSVFIVKTNALGDTLWTKIFYKQDVNTGYDIIQTYDNNYIIGVTLSNTVTTHDFMLLKIDNLGDTIWTKVYDKGGDDWLSSIVELSNGDIVVSGRTNSIGYGGVDAFLARYNSIGDEIWFKTYGGANDDLGGKITLSNDSGIVFSGTTYSFGNGSGDVYLIKANLNGDTIWTKTYGGINYDMGGGSIIQTNDNGFITGGITESYGNGVQMFLVKTREDGFASINERIYMDIKMFPNPTNGLLNFKFQSGFEFPLPYSISSIDGKTITFGVVNSENQTISLTDRGIYIITLQKDGTSISNKIIVE